MSSLAKEKPLGTDNGPTVADKKPEKTVKSTPAQQSAQSRPARKRPVRDNINRAYWVCEMSGPGGIARLICKFPTIGQARKNRAIVASSAGILVQATCIVRTVIVD